MSILDRLIFRGKSVDTYDWIVGSHVYSPSENQHYIIEHSGEELQFPVLPETVGQSTGFSADKGDGTVLVYDGDIVSWNGKVFEVKKTYGTPCLVRHQGDMFEIFEDNAWNDHVFPLIQFNWHYCDISEPYLDVEVIGNKFDSPELIES